MSQGLPWRASERHRVPEQPVDAATAAPSTAPRASHLRDLLTLRAQRAAVARARWVSSGRVAAVSALMVVLVAVPTWLWQFRPFDPRHGFGPDYPSAGIGAAQAPLGAPPALPGGKGGYAFMQVQADGRSPVAFDPCRPVHYVVASAGLPDGGEALVREATDVMSQASGLRFVYDGLTDELPTRDRDPYQPERYGDRWAPVYVAFATPAQVPGLAGTAIGLGGSTPRAASDGVLVYVTGSVWLDRDPMAALLAAGRRDSARAVVEHEVGHVLGLDHVTDRGQLMDASGGQVSGPADGDLRGLAILGRGACRPDL